MREAHFVKINKQKWLKFESYLSNKGDLPPIDLSNLYLELTDDLSFAQTFYPHSPTSIYLNQLAVKAHQKIYVTKIEAKSTILDFYMRKFPLMFYKFLPQLAFSFCFFLFFVLVGVYSSATEGVFVRSILGDAYVNMTLENIEKGDPMAVYKKMERVEMFLGITINNIQVALKAFSMGIFLGFGTLYILMSNAVMLGSFQYFFYEQGILWESARTIWIHGTIEISVIIVAGCGGIVLGNSLIFPGTYSRLDSFKIGVKSGLKILLSTLPFFVVAGFLEGFITRITDMPDSISLLIIIGSLCTIIFYYVIYPIKLNIQTKNEQLHRI
jgi:uncharacterized membrane protein SpoIIM required for sporulation